MPIQEGLALRHLSILTVVVFATACPPHVRRNPKQEASEEFSSCGELPPNSVTEEQQKTVSTLLGIKVPGRVNAGLDVNVDDRVKNAVILVSGSQMAEAWFLTFACRQHATGQIPDDQYRAIVRDAHSAFCRIEAD